MLERENTMLLIIDVQGALAQSMYEKEKLFDNLQKIIKGIQVLKLPILWAEQIPEKLGPTIPEIKSLLTDIHPLVKKAFSCYGEQAFVDKLESLNRRQVLIAGIETHVCVYQTVMDLIHFKYEAHVLADAVSSRTAENKYIGLDRMKTSGASITSVETALFELLRIAEGAEFKEFIKIVK